MAAYLRHVRCARVFFPQGKTVEAWLNPRGIHTCCNRKTAVDLRRLTQRFHHKTHIQGSRLLRHQYVVFGVVPARFNSTESEFVTDQAAQVLPDLPEGYIPDAPPIPELTNLAEPVLTALGEPTLASLGLANWTPSGLFQMGLENLHVMADIPWWGAIVIATVTLRICIFPIVILGQRNAANMANHMPTMTRLQERFTKARMSGNPMESMQAGSELQDYMKRNNVNPFRNMMAPLAQLPIFVSVFVGLRQMASLPVESMSTGGLLWFTNLTIPDPFYAMPIITMLTFLLTIEVGADGMKAGNMTHTIKWVMRIMPVVMLPIIINFPAAMLCYWCTSNSISLAQVLLLRIPSVRTFFKIPVLVKHDEKTMGKKKKFVEGFQDTWKNSRLLAQVEDRQRMDAVRFKEAGTAPIQKTYSYDPTKLKSKQTMSAKGK